MVDLRRCWVLLNWVWESVWVRGRYSGCEDERKKCVKQSIRNRAEAMDEENRVERQRENCEEGGL